MKHINNTIPDQTIGYLDEHFTLMKKAVDNMEIALEERNARQFIDNFSAMQWQERSIIAACKQIMTLCDFVEKDLMMRTLDEYEVK